MYTIKFSGIIKFHSTIFTYIAAPTTDKATARPIPVHAHIYGIVS